MNGCCVCVEVRNIVESIMEKSAFTCTVMSQENQLNQLLTHANLRIGTEKKIRFISFGMNGAVCVCVCVCVCV